MADDSSSYQARDVMPDLLLVEDNPLHLRLVKSMLADIWPPNQVAEIRHARSLEEAVDEVAGEAPDCVLLDLVLPDADGLETLAGVRDANPLVPIVILSSHEDAEMARDAIIAGAQDYLVKGAVSPADLRRAVWFAMGRRDHERQRAAGGAALEPWPAARQVAAAPPLVAPTPEPDTAQIGIAVFDVAGSMMFVDPDVARAVGRSVDELITMPLEDLVHPNDLVKWTKLMEGEPGQIDIRYMHPSGHPIYLKVSVRHVLAGTGREGATVASYAAGGEVGTASTGAYVVMTDWG